MLRLRYTAWDGTQEVRLEADRVFEKLSEYLSFTDDVQQALDWLLHQGLEWEDGIRVMGLDDFLEQLREEMRSRYRQVNLRDAFTELRERLEELLDLERDALDRRGDPDAARARGSTSSRPASPRRSSACATTLTDDDARRALADLLDELENIRDLEDFDAATATFPGPKSLSYGEAVELMREMERLKRLEEELLSGNLETVDLETLRERLGPDAARNFQLLKEVMLLLVNAGYVTQREGRARLSPKGVRKIGQLALRDIYQSLLRDRPGSHQTDHRGTIELKPEREAVPARRLAGARPRPTLKKALARRPGTPLDLRPEDFEVHGSAHTTTTSTVLLLDMSWSMSWRAASPPPRRSRWRWRA
jgi:uncharacterized protein with von Willebrand factor type A (vWA) domain